MGGKKTEDRRQKTAAEGETSLRFFFSTHAPGGSMQSRAMKTNSARNRQFHSNTNARSLLRDSLVWLYSTDVDSVRVRAR